MVMLQSAGMVRALVDLRQLLSLANGPEALSDLVSYFGTDLPAGSAPRYTGGRFEGLAGGGDRPEAADQIDADDLIAVEMLSVQVPGPVALALLEGDLGRDVATQLARIPTEVSIGDPAAEELLADGGSADIAWSLLERPRNMGWVTAGKLLARKRPRLVPVYDNVVRCAFGRPAKPWKWLHARFTEDGGVLAEHLVAARDAAGVEPTVSPLRVLDVLVWMRHRPVHLRGACPGLLT
jgi:hypothetical protein